MQTSTTPANSWQRHLALVVMVLVIAIAAVAAAATFIKAIEVMCLLFLGVVFSVFVRKCGKWVGQQTKLGTGVGIAAVAAGLVAMAAAGIWLTGGAIVERARQAADEFDSTISETQEILKEYPVAESIILGVPGLGDVLKSSQSNQQSRQQNDVDSSHQSSDPNAVTGSPNRDETNSKPETASRISVPMDKFVNGETADQAAKIGGKALAAVLKLFSTTFGALTSLAVIFFVGLFLASDPNQYRDGLSKLVPESRRSRFIQLSDELASTLWAWLLGRFGTMAITGVGVWAVMALLGVPLASLLGIFTALMVFIPNIGAVIAVALAVLLAVPKGVGTVAMVVIAYTLFQLLEGYVLTPLIQQRAVQLPPALLIASQLILGVLLGFLGVMVATPLVAIAIVLVRRVYVDDLFELFATE